jgi:deaminated glutathione amidase
MRVAVCQMHSGDDVEANLEAAEALLREAAAGGADLAALPEYFGYLGPSGRRRGLAEAVPGPVSDRIAGVTRALGIWVLGGTVLELDEGRVYDTALLFDRTGEVVARYRKIHLYDVDLPGQPPIRESASITAGDQLVTHETEFARVGLSVCYDVRFPELYRGLMAMGAEVLFVPAQFQHETGRDHWHVLVRARAIEDQCFVVAPAQCGRFGDPEKGRRSFGHSLVVDPWGRVLAEGSEDETGVWFAELDMAELRRVRRALPALQHRRLGISC